MHLKVAKYSSSLDARLTKTLIIKAIMLLVAISGGQRCSTLERPNKVHVNVLPRQSGRARI